MRANRERPFTVTAGGTTYTFHLAEWRPYPYRPVYEPVPVSPRSTEGQPVDPLLSEVHVVEWSGGEGNDWWRPGEPRYNFSLRVQPNPEGAEGGVVLGAHTTTTTDAVPATFADGYTFGFADGKLWAGDDATVHAWDDTNSQWSTAGWAIGATSVVTSIVDFEDGANVLVGLGNGSVRKVASGANSELVAAIASGRDPVLVNFDGTTYLLDGVDLYSVNRTTGALTQVSDTIGGISTRWWDNETLTYGRLGTSDKGPIWLQRMDSGEVYIWEYNVADDTTRRIGTLPVPFAYPYSIYFANGFVFVGFRYAQEHAKAGDPYLYYQRASQRGVAGPFRKQAGTQNRAVLIAGVDGDDLLVFYDQQLWAYNFTSGGISQVGFVDNLDTEVRDAVTFGRAVYLSNGTNNNVNKVDRTLYSSGTAWIRLGRMDFSLPSAQKVLLDVKVTLHEALPTNTNINLRVAKDGQAFSAALGSQWNGNGSATTNTWTISSSSTSYVARDFEVRLDLATTDTSITPTIRSVTLRAAAVDKIRTQTFEVDLGGDRAGRTASDVLADLATIAKYDGIVAVAHPYDLDEVDTAVSYEVWCTGLEAPDTWPASEQASAVIQFRDVSLV